MNIYNIDDQLFNLSAACSANLNNNKCSMWVLYAVSRHIDTGRATRDFEKRFCTLSREQLDQLVNYSLMTGLSDDDIIKRVKNFLSKAIDK